MGRGFEKFLANESGNEGRGGRDRKLPWVNPRRKVDNSIDSFQEIDHHPYTLNFVLHSLRASRRIVSYIQNDDLFVLYIFDRILTYSGLSFLSFPRTTSFSNFSRWPFKNSMSFNRNSSLMISRSLTGFTSPST